MKIIYMCIFMIFTLHLEAHTCFYVSSYHQEYEWDQGIRNGLEPILKKHCKINYFFMDTQRNTSPAFAHNKALEALSEIQKSKPDIIIAADDSASKYLVMPYLKNTTTPVVFCGINTSADIYGYPYKNATGMVEITPYKPIQLALNSVLDAPKKGVFVSADVISQHRMYHQLKKDFERHGIALEKRFVKTQKEWEETWNQEHKHDFIFIGNPAGIKDWEIKKAVEFTQKNTHIFTVTAWDWLSDIAMVTVNKEPEEQGEWAAKVAVAVLEDNVMIDTIPIVTNKRWNMFVNQQLLKKGGFNTSIHMNHIVGKR